MVAIVAHELPMPMYGCIRELRLQLFEQRGKCLLLFRCASVLRCLAISGQSTDIADTDRVFVVPALLAVGTLLRQRATRVGASVAIDHVVIAYRAELPGLVPSCDVLDGEVLALRRGRAMDDDFVDAAHEKV